VTDHYEQAQRMIRDSSISADAAAITHAILALTQALGVNSTPIGYTLADYEPDPDLSRPGVIIKPPNGAHR